MKLKVLLLRHRTIIAIGFEGNPVAVAGVVCALTRFNGMVWGQVKPDGWDATDVLTTPIVYLRATYNLLYMSV